MKEIDEKDLVEITGGGIGDKLLDIELEKPTDGGVDKGGSPGLTSGVGDDSDSGSNTGTDNVGGGGSGTSTIQ